MPLQIIDCVQGTPEWFAARAGLPTASEFSTILASGKAGAESKTRRTYLLKLAGEILTGEPMESYTNAHMERGHEWEPEARERYAYLSGVEPQIVGFIRNGAKGCSPDSLVGDVGAVEIKTKLPHLHIDCLLKGEFPPDHKAQCQGILWVAEREWIDLVVYCRRLPLFVTRATRDKVYIANLSREVDRFNDELQATVERIRAYGMQEAA